MASQEPASHHAARVYIQLKRKAEQVVMYDRSIVGVEGGIQNTSDCKRGVDGIKISQLTITYNGFPCFLWYTYAITQISKFTQVY